MSDLHKYPPNGSPSDGSSRSNASEYDKGASVIASERGGSLTQTFVIIGLVAVLAIALIAFIFKERAEVKRLQAEKEAKQLEVDQINKDLPAYFAQQTQVFGNWVIKSVPDKLELIRMPSDAYNPSGWFVDDLRIEKIRIPITHEYVLHSTGDWKIRIKGNVALITVPPVVALPPKVAIDHIQRKFGEEWVPVSREDAMKIQDETKDLLKTQSIKVFQSQRDVILEDARKNLEATLLKWVISKKVFEDIDFASVKVIISPSATVSTPVTTDAKEVASSGNTLENTLKSAIGVKEKTPSTTSAPTTLPTMETPGKSAQEMPK